MNAAVEVGNFHFGKLLNQHVSLISYLMMEPLEPSNVDIKRMTQQLDQLMMRIAPAQRNYSTREDVRGAS